MTVADRNERKSAADGIFFEAVRRFEKEKALEWASAMRDYRTEKLIFEERKKALAHQLRKELHPGGDPDELLAELENHLQSAPQKPRDPTLFYSNTTPEALLWGLGHDHPYAGLIAAEGGIVLEGHALRRLGELNDLWDSRDIQVRRAISDSYTVRDARLTISIMVQPDVIRKYLARKGLEFAGSGFRARCLWSEPETTQGTRFIVNPNPSREQLRKFGSRLIELLRRSMPDKHGSFPPRQLLTLSHKAQVLWIKYHDEIERNLAFLGLFVDVRDGAGKMAENAARMAGMFHVFLGRDGPVQEDLMESAIAICSWHLMEFKRMFGTQAAITQVGDDAKLLEAWLHSNRHRFPYIDAVPKVQIARFGPNPLRSKSRLDPALEILVSQNKVELVPGPHASVWVRLNLSYFTNGGSGLFIT
jgi:putative DNA primase/helicase